MKRTHFSFMEENPNPNDNLIHISNQQNPAFSGKRNKHSEAINLVGSQSMQAVGGHVSIPQMDNLGHERLRRHQDEVAGHVVIPDSWGQEELLKDWIDYSPFDALLVPKGLTSAREALAMEGRRANTSHGVPRIERGSSPWTQERIQFPTSPHLPIKRSKRTNKHTSRDCWYYMDVDNPDQY